MRKEIAGLVGGAVVSRGRGVVFRRKWKVRGACCDGVLSDRE